jgi:radical SAM protein with 4Fe4S-binding SPASM domain
MNLINPEVRIETTNFCNAKCMTCPRDQMTRKKVTMSYNHFCSLVVEAYELGATDISPFGYGEPLMDKGIAEKVAFCTRMGLKTFITTNGAFLTADKAKELIDAGISHVRFSAHGTFDNYEKSHGLDWYVFMRNVFNFIKVSRGKVKIDITAIPMHGESVDEILEFWEGTVDDIEIWKPHGWGGKKQYRKSPVKLPTCGRPQRGPVQIQSDGMVIPCCFLMDAEITLGNTYEDSIEDILKGEACQELKRKHTNGNLDGLVCKYCDQRLVLDESPLLYSSIGGGINKTSSVKFNLLEEENGRSNIIKINEN